MSDANTNSLNGKHIVIVSIHYWPEETGIGPYSTDTAEYYASQGARVTVLTTMPFYPQWKRRAGYDHGLVKTEIQNGVEIRRIRQYIPSQQSALRRAFYELTFLGVLLRAPWKSRPDAVLGVIPSVSGGIVTRIISVLKRVPYGIIIQDLSGQAATQSGISGGTRIAKLTSAIEGHICRHAKRIAIVSPAFMAPLKALGVETAKVTEIRNWSHIPPSDKPAKETRASLGWQDSDFAILHAGNMGLKQGLDLLLDAARNVATELPNVRFVLMGDGNQRAALQAQAKNLTNVEFMDPVQPTEFSDVLAAADILLVHERPTVTDMSLPSKLTSYFVAGRPILAAVNQNGATADEIRRSGAGTIISPGSTEELKDAIQEWIRAPNNGTEQIRLAGAYSRTFLSRAAGLASMRKFLYGVVALYRM